MWLVCQCALLYQSCSLCSPIVLCHVVCLQVRMIEAAKEKLQKDMRSSSSKNLAAMVTVQA